MNIRNENLFKNHGKFLNKFFKTDFRDFNKSRWSMGKSIWVWFINSDKDKRDGWRIDVIDDVIVENYEGKGGIPYRSAVEKAYRVAIEFTECGEYNKYKFLGIYEYDFESSDYFSRVFVLSDLPKTMETSDRVSRYFERIFDTNFDPDRCYGREEIREYPSFGGQELSSDLGFFLDEEDESEKQKDIFCAEIPLCNRAQHICASPAEGHRADRSLASRKSLKPDDQKRIIEELQRMDKSFSEMLFYYIDKKGISDVECYRRAQVDRKIFSKIKCKKDYKPGKPTALAFAIALRLNLRETDNLLRTLGYSLSQSFEFDVIVRYCITREIYDIDIINLILLEHDAPLLGYR